MEFERLITCDQYENLQPGENIEFTSKAQLLDFENHFAKLVNPDMTDDQQIDWKHRRQKITDSITPPNFIGPLKDIAVEIMEDPFQTLLDSYTKIDLKRKKDKGIFVKGFMLPRESIENPSIEQREEFKGIVVTANAKSGGKIIGQYKTEIWYLPVQVDTSAGGESRVASAAGGVRRIITNPELITDAEHSPDDPVRNMGAAALGKRHQRRSEKSVKPTGNHKLPSVD